MKVRSSPLDNNYDTASTCVDHLNYNTFLTHVKHVGSLMYLLFGYENKSAVKESSIAIMQVNVRW